MKECKNCEYCDGFDYSDGTPECSHEGGYMHCPFNDHEQVQRNRNSDNAFQIIIDGKAMEEYIKNTVSNTVENEAAGIAKVYIQKMISDKYEEIIEGFTEAEVKLQVEKQVAAFMAGDITAGGGSGQRRTAETPANLRKSVRTTTSPSEKKSGYNFVIVALWRTTFPRFYGISRGVFWPHGRGWSPVEMVYIKLYLDDLEALEPYGDAERGRLLTALLEYARTGEAPQLGGNERYLFPMMRARLDRDRDALEGLSQQRSEAGKKGALAKLSRAKQSLAKEATPGKSSNNKDNNKDKRLKTNIPPGVPPEGEDVFAEYSQGDQALLEALRGFEEARRRLKKPLTDRGKALLLSRLDKLAEGVADKARYKRECLEEATLNGWQAVYPLKEFADGEGDGDDGGEMLPDTQRVHLPEDATLDDILALIP